MKAKPSKNLILVIAVLVVIIIAVGFVASKKRNTPQAEQKIAKNEGVFDSIKDAMTKSLSLKCEYAVGADKTIAYVKGNSIRIEGTWQGKKDTVAILKENKLWSWDNEKKEGMIVPLIADKDASGTSSEDIIGNLEQQKQFCKVAVFPDSLFEPPSDIKFQDLSSFLQSPIPQPSPAN